MCQFFVPPCIRVNAQLLHGWRWSPPPCITVLCLTCTYSRRVVRSLVHGSL